jgi:hypothetical protein
MRENSMQWLLLMPKTLPPHNEAVHRRDSIREHLKAPLSQGVCELTFDGTYIEQPGPIVWDLGTYRITVPQSDGTEKEHHGKMS